MQGAQPRPQHISGVGLSGGDGRGSSTGQDFRKTLMGLGREDFSLRVVGEAMASNTKVIPPSECVKSQ